MNGFPYARDPLYLYTEPERCSSICPLPIRTANYLLSLVDPYANSVNARTRFLPSIRLNMASNSPAVHFFTLVRGQLGCVNSGIIKSFYLTQVIVAGRLVGRNDI